MSAGAGEQQRMVGFSAGLPNQAILSKMPNMGGAIPLRSEAPTQYQNTGATVRVRGFERHPVVQACIRVITDLFATIPYQAYDKIGEDADEIEVLSEDHPANQILEHPSPMFSAHRLRALTSVHYLTYGNALWFFERPDVTQGIVTGQGMRGYREPAPTSLRLIQPEDLLTVYVNQKAYPLWYWWRDVLGYPHVSPVTDIMHFRDLNAKGIVFGYPRAASALNDIIGDDEASQYVRQVVTNSGMPPAFALAEEYLTPEKAAAMESALFEKWVTRGERGRFAFMGGVKDIKSVGFSLNDLEFPDLRKIAREDICFAPGTLVHTARGLVPIESIVVGDRVLTHKGRYRDVTATNARPYSGPVVRLRAKGLDTVRCTPNHSWWADHAKPMGRASNKRRRTSEPGWVRAEHLDSREPLLAQPNHYTRSGSHRLTMPNVLESGATSIDLLDIYKGPVNERGEMIRPKGGRGTWVPRHLALDASLGWLIGMYVAEGAKGRSQVVWSINKAEMAFAARIAKCLAVYGVRATRRVAVSTLNVTASSHILRALFATMGDYSHTKVLPEWAMTAPREFRRALVEGYVDGDGHRFGRTVRVSTVSTSLAAQLRLLLWTEQMHGTATVRPAGRWSIEGRSGNSRPATSVAWIADQRRRGSIAHEDGYAAFPVTDKSTEQYDGLVYNLTADEDHSYVTIGGTAKNCAAFGVDPRMIGIGSATNDGGLSGIQFKEARTRLIQQTVEPMLNAFVSELNMWLAPEFGSKVYYRYDPDVFKKLVEDDDTTSIRVARELTAGMRTVEEAREAIDLEPAMDPTHTLAIGPVQFIPVAQALAGTLPPGMPPGMLPPGAPPGMLPPGTDPNAPPGNGGPVLAPPGDGAAALPPGTETPGTPTGAPDQRIPQQIAAMSGDGRTLASTTGQDPNNPNRTPKYNDGARDPADKREKALPGNGVPTPGQPPVAGSPTDLAAAPPNGLASEAQPQPSGALTAPIQNGPVPVTTDEWARIGQILGIVALGEGGQFIERVKAEVRAQPRGNRGEWRHHATVDELRDAWTPIVESPEDWRSKVADPDALKLGPTQSMPMRYIRMAEKDQKSEKISSLVASIAINARHVPAIVVEPDGDYRFVIRDGHHRFLAAQKLERRSVPVRVLGDGNRVPFADNPPPAEGEDAGPDKKKEPEQRSDTVATPRDETRRAYWEDFDQRARAEEEPFRLTAARLFSEERRAIARAFEVAADQDGDAKAVIMRVGADILRMYREGGTIDTRWSHEFTPLIARVIERGASRVVVDRSGTTKRAAGVLDPTSLAKAAGGKSARVVGPTFDLQNPWVIDAVNARATKLGQFVGQTTAQNITAALRVALGQGMGIADTAKLIDQSVFGLQASQRSTTIAQTESVGSLNEGTYAGAKGGGMSKSIGSTKETRSSGTAIGIARHRDG